jgi:hypothetical protein
MISLVHDGAEVDPTLARGPRVWAPEENALKSQHFQRVLRTFPASKKRSLSDSERSKFFSEFSNPSTAKTPRKRRKTCGARWTT